MDEAKGDASEAEGATGKHFCFHAVAHLDLLGQSDALAELDALPHPPTPEEFQPCLDKTAKRVRRLRRFFQNYFDAARHDEFVDWPADLREAAKRLPVTEPVARSGSDTTVITVSLRKSDKSAAPNLLGVYKTLIGAAGAMMVSLRVGMMVRGGIEVGRVIEMLPVPGQPDTKDVYGAVLGRAYILESKIADYPRIVVGDDLLKMLESVEAEPPHDDGWKVAAHLAKLCRELLIRDVSDGLEMLDYLGPEMRARGNVTVGQLREIRDFVEAEKQRFRDERNPKLALRYARLLGYCAISLAEAEKEPPGAEKKGDKV